MEIKIATKEQLPAIRKLLKQVNLPTGDPEKLLGQLYVVEYEGEVIACGGFEYYPPLALLRSVAVDTNFQGQGIGSKLVSHILDVLKAMQVEAVYLLTDTAESFFQRKFYFTPIPREDSPGLIQQSSEFKEIVCQDAVCMVRTLKEF